jgi:CDP-diacylglycerol--glycerol-3-phosphate 3-phosphatidyltransferase
MNGQLINLPNLMTFFRFPAGLLMLWLVMRLTTDDHPAWISIVVLIIAILTFLTDFYDGRLARRYHLVTDAGKMLDPIADSLFFTLLMMGLALSPRFEVSIWFTVIMLYREAGVQTIRRVAALKGVVLMAGWAGKLKMALQGIVMGVLGFAVFFNDTGIYAIDENTLIFLAWFGSAVTALCGLLSVAAYVKQLPAMIKEQATASNAAPPKADNP